MMNGYDMNGWSWFGMATMVTLTLTIVALIFWASQRRREPSAREMLDRQLAGGKIDTREYRERLDALREDHATR